MSDGFLLFDTIDHDNGAGAAPRVQPWKTVPLDARYAGAWVVAGDVDGDGAMEIVSARNVDQDDVHYTSTAVAHRLDGSVLWRWGDPSVGRRGLHHDVACQVHDWDGDGINEVVLCGKDHLVELEGPTGRQRRQLPLPPQASDCVVFADLSGRGHAGDVLVKTRYGQIWAFDYAGKWLWTIEKPAGYPTAHQPVPVDIDGDGRDEIMAGYAMLNPDGSLRWKLDPGKSGLGRGHLDCCRVMRRGSRPSDWRLVLTCCGDQKLCLIDGEGRLCWELCGHHFESIDVGRVCPEVPGLQICVDIVRPYGQQVLWVVDEQGRPLGQIATDYTRFHTVTDWTGEGIDQIILPHSRGVFDGQGKRIATFAIDATRDLHDPQGPGEIGHIVLRGDMDGDGIADVTITAPAAAQIFKPPHRRRPPAPVSMGTVPNFTLY